MLTKKIRQNGEEAARMFDVWCSDFRF